MQPIRHHSFRGVLHANGFNALCLLVCLSVCAPVDDVVRDAFELRFENLCIAVLKEGGRNTEGVRGHCAMVEEIAVR